MINKRFFERPCSYRFNRPWLVFVQFENQPFCERIGLRENTHSPTYSHSLALTHARPLAHTRSHTHSLTHTHTHISALPSMAVHWTDRMSDGQVLPAFFSYQWCSLQQVTQLETKRQNDVSEQTERGRYPTDRMWNSSIENQHYWSIFALIECRTSPKKISWLPNSITGRQSNSKFTGTTTKREWISFVSKA